MKVQKVRKMGIYEILFRGGFGLADNIQSLAYLIEHNDGIEIVEKESLEKAYESCCIKYVDRKLRSDPYLRPLLPRFDDVFRVPFHEPGYMEHVASIRFFAILNKDFVGVFSSVEKALEFVNAIHPVWLKEFSNEFDGVSWLNFQVMRCILPMSAYFSGTIPYIKKLPLNVAVPIPYAQWLSEHYVPDPRLSFGENSLLEQQNLHQISTTAENKKQEGE